jgi:amino-acid N-acetyltransferase
VTTEAMRAATGRDHAAVIGLLEAASLPTAGVPAGLDDYLVAERGGRIVGAIGLERYGTAALLRSAVVEPGARGTGLGTALVERLLDAARTGGVREVFLLTTTAEGYFPRFGFAPITREEVPAGVKASVEFQGACPASAVVMRRVMIPI